MFRLAALGGAAVLLVQAARALAGDPYQIADLAPGPGDAGIETLRATGTSVVFRRAAQALWASDGTAAGTIPLHAGPADELTEHDGRVAFTAPSATAPLEDLWLTDGTPAGTVLVRSIAGEGSCPILSECPPAAPHLDALTSVGELLYFRQNGYGLWRSDGTDPGTERIGFYASQACSAGCLCCFYLGADLSQLTAVNQRLSYVVTNGFTNELLLDRADGTTTVPIASNLTIAAMAGVRGRLFMAVQGFVPTALWVDDGDGTRQVAVLGDGSRPASQLTAAGGLLYFVLGAGTPAAELWRSDGTATGTVPLLAGDATELTAFAGGLAFRRLQAGGDQLWRSDGTAAGTAMVSLLTPSELTALDATLYFTASDGDGAELWQSDGTAAGTLQVADLVPGPDGSAPADLTAACGRLYFTAATAAAGRELWALDVAPGACAATVEADCTQPGQCTLDTPCTAGHCDAATGCSTFTLACCSDAACADGDACTIDQCNPLLGCGYTPVDDLAAVTCVFGASGSEAARCPGKSLPRYLQGPFDRVRSLLARAGVQVDPTRALRRVAGAVRVLDRTQIRIDRAWSRGAISVTCRTALSDMVATGRARAVAWQP